MFQFRNGDWLDGCTLRSSILGSLILGGCWRMTVAIGAIYRDDGLYELGLETGRRLRGNFNIFAVPVIRRGFASTTIQWTAIGRFLPGFLHSSKGSPGSMPCASILRATIGGTYITRPSVKWNNTRSP